MKEETYVDKHGTTYHEEEIVCPSCGKVQIGNVMHTFPFATFIHDCIKCKFIIMESEWQLSEKKNEKKSRGKRK